MHICLVIEGCYPYIVGGVSSWTQSLISHFPEHTFSIVSINPEKEKRGQFKYQIPENVQEIKEIFLDELMEQEGQWNKKIKLNKQETGALKMLLNGERIDWHVLFELFSANNSNKGFNAVDFLLSKQFYYILQESYENEYSHIPFTDVFWTLRSMYMTLFSMLEQEPLKADVYHCVSTGYAGILAASMAYCEKKPLLLTEHGIYTREREEEIIKSDWVEGAFKNLWIAYFKNLSHGIYSNADRVISLFERNKDIQVELGCQSSKIEIIHNGIQNRHFIDEKSVKGDNSAGIVVAGIVRVVPIKDIKTMLHVFSIVEKACKNVEFLIIGPLDENPAYYEECMNYKESLGLTCVQFTGRVDVQEYLPKIDIHVLTSISEGQPLTVLETLAHKIPNVVTNVGDCAQIINGHDAYGQAGFVSNVMDAEGLAKGIIQLVNSYELRMTFGENGYKRVKNRYTFDNFIDSYRKLYGEFEERRGIAWPG